MVMLEQIWSRKTSAGPRADKSSVIRFGPVPQITIPARGFRKTAQRGLTEDRTRSQIHASETSCIFSGNHRRPAAEIAPHKQAEHMKATDHRNSTKSALAKGGVHI